MSTVSASVVPPVCPKLLPYPPTPSQMLDLPFSYCYTYNATLWSHEILNENLRCQPCVIPMNCCWSGRFQDPKQFASALGCSQELNDNTPLLKTEHILILGHGKKSSWYLVANLLPIGKCSQCQEMLCRLLWEAMEEELSVLLDVPVVTWTLWK